MANLFALITPYPDELVRCSDPMGDNDLWLERVSASCHQILFCWRSHHMAREKGAWVSERLNDYALGTNNDGSPKHPLYVKRGTNPKKYEPIP
jgi:hypothetical protein